MKIKMYRSSGKPVLPAHEKLYTEDMNRIFDETEVEVGKFTQENAKVFGEKLEAKTKELLGKYPNCIEVEYPTSQYRLKQMMKQYGSIAFCIEDGKTVCYVMDA